MLFSVITLLKEEILVLAHAQPLTTEIFERIRGHGAEFYDSYDYQEGIRSFLRKKGKSVFQGMITCRLSRLAEKPYINAPPLTLIC